MGGLRRAVDRLPEEHRSDVVADIDMVEKQSQSPQPRLGTVRECLISLRAVFENAGGEMLAGPLAQWIQQYKWW